MAQVFQNGINYDASHIQIIMLGAPIISIMKIGWSFNRDSKETYGMGAEPIGRGFGQKTYTGTDLDMLKEDYDALVAAAPDGDISLIPPFQVKVIWAPDTNNVSTASVTLQNVSLKGMGQDINAGDTAIRTKIPFVFAGITQE